MAKQPVPDFNPYREVTPAATMGDFYRQPGILALPETGLDQIAESLRGLSPSLHQFIGRTAEAENEAQMTQGEIDASLLDAEKARDASRGHFVKLEQSGDIPKGASPFRLAALQQAAGKRAIEVDLRSTLNENINRLSDPGSDEDLGEFVHDAFLEVTKGMGFYAQGAAVASLDSVERQFLTRTALLKAEKIELTNNQNLTSAAFIAGTTPSDPDIDLPDELSGMTSALQTLADEHHQTTGDSGRPQLYDGVKAAVIDMARNGDKEGAANLILAFEAVMVGGQPLGEFFAAELGDLEDKVETAAETHDDDQLNDVRNAAALRTLASGQAFEHFHTTLTPDKLRNMNVSELQGAITAYIQKEFELDEDEARLASSGTMLALERTQRNAVMDPAAVVELGRIYADTTSTFDEKMRRLAELPLTPEALSQGIRYLTAKEGEDVNTRALHSEVSELRASSSRLVRDMMEAGGYSPENVYRVITEYQRQADEIVAREAQRSGTMTERGVATRDAITDLANLFAENIGPITEPISPEAPTATAEAVRRRRLEELEAAPQPPVLKQPGTHWWIVEGPAAHNLEVLQDKEATPEDKDAAKSTILANASAQTKWLRHGNGFGPGAISEATELELIRLTSITGFTLEEIKDGRLLVGGPNEFQLPFTEGRYVKLPEVVLNPRWSILIPDVETVEDLEALYKSPEGQDQLQEIMAALPTGLRITDLKEFVRLQRQLIKRYRPSGVTEETDATTN